MKKQNRNTTEENYADQKLPSGLSINEQRKEEKKSLHKVYIVSC